MNARKRSPHPISLQEQQLTKSHHDNKGDASDSAKFEENAGYVEDARNTGDAEHSDFTGCWEISGYTGTLGYTPCLENRSDVWTSVERNLRVLERIDAAFSSTQSVDAASNTDDDSSAHLADADAFLLQLNAETTDSKSVQCKISGKKVEAGGGSDEAYAAADTTQEPSSSNLQATGKYSGEMAREAEREATAQTDSTSLEAKPFRGHPDESGTTVEIPTLQGSYRSSENSFNAHDLLLQTEHKLWRGLLPILVSLGLRERDILPGHQRVRWKDAYGRTLYDDYQELEPGGLEDLETYLKSAAYQSHHQTSATQIPATSGLANRDTQTNLSNSGNTSDQVSNSQPLNSRFLEDLEKGHSSSDGEGKPSGTLDLIICVGRGYKDELLPQSVIHIENDQQLFRTLRDSYKTHVGRTRRICSLKTVGSINFMMLGYGGPGDLEVRCHNDLCQEPRCRCIPPLELVGSEYLCNPVPTPLSPPVGPRLMMSFFTNPDAMNTNQRRILNQLPKRTLGNLDLNYTEGITKAWGIYYEENWNWAKIWWILGLAFFPPSFLFGILWGVLKQDIQGAFGIASWWMAGASIVIGIVGTSTWAK